MTTFVLIPGGWQGGWIYQTLADLLAARGHQTLPITLSGLGDAPAPKANLASHIGEVVGAVESVRDEVVLVGQSYGGMVSGVADAVPSLIRALVYVDAYVPNSGDSVWSLTTPRFRDLFIAGAGNAQLRAASQSRPAMPAAPHRDVSSIDRPQWALA